MADKTVGVIGGLGPEASLHFYARVLALTPASRDQDHLHLIIDSNPKTANRNDALAGRGPSPAPQLVASARRLEQAGAQVLVMACNTAHAWEAEIRAATAVPFISIIETTAGEAARLAPAGAPVGLLAAEGCLRAGLFQHALADRGLRPVLLPDGDQDAFMALVYRIKAGVLGQEERACMAGFVRRLVDLGAAAIVAGCTEVPLVLPAGAAPCPLIDSTEALAQATVAYALSGGDRSGTRAARAVASPADSSPATHHDCHAP